MKVLTSEQIRLCEQQAILGGATYDSLMANAGKAAAEEIIKRYDVANKKITILAGNGNNGGDGFVIADILRKVNARVELVMPLGNPVSKTAQNAYALCENIKKADILDEQSDIIIDALFGIGLNRDMPKEVCELIDAANKSEAVKIAVDIPSGVFADGGVSSLAFKADLTLTMIALKPCFFLPFSNEYCGEVKVLDIGAPVREYAYLTTEEPRLLERAVNSHKGSFGTVLAVCGSFGMCGAQILSVRAALKSGVGLVRTFVCDKNYSALCVSAPEAVTIPVKTAKNGSMNIKKKALLREIKRCSVVALGCGLGQTRNAKRLVKMVINNAECPIVLDADGINAISDDISIIRKCKGLMILTPHPAEMARLCKKSVAKVQANRVDTAREFATENNCILVLKGANTVIAMRDGSVYFNTTGNTGLATGGSGDVLTGLIAGLIAQGEPPENAVKAAVWLHGNAADRAVKEIGERSLLGSDVISHLNLK